MRVDVQYMEIDRPSPLSTLQILMPISDKGGTLGSERDAKVWLHGHKIERILNVPAAYQSRVGEGDAGFIHMESDEENLCQIGGGAARQPQRSSAPATILLHNAHFRDIGCRFRPPLTPFLTPLAPRGPRDREPLLLGKCSRMPRNLLPSPFPFSIYPSLSLFLQA
jgi:hypothetical protein